MGFFSWECRGCSNPILNPYSTDANTSWMMEAVALTPHGAVHIGTYDGYGRIEGVEVTWNNPEFWHQACWDLAGSPKVYAQGSEDAENQGYFFDDDEYADAKPR